METAAEAEEAVAGGGARKRKRDGGAGGGEAPREEDDGEEGYEGIAEESVAELMRWLEMEISAAAAGRKEEELDEGPAAAAAPGFVTINGNEESCGPSFSAAASTVMASVDTRTGAPPPPPVPWPFPAPSSAACDDDDVAELAADEQQEWLVELLTSGPATQDEQLAS